MTIRDLTLGVVFLGAALAPAGAQEKPPMHPPGKVPPEIVERVRAELNDDADLQDCLQEESEEPVKVEELLSAEAIDLGPGHQALVVRGIGECLCSPTGNCEVWVFETPAGGAPALLLRATAVQEVTLKESASNGYRDLMTSMRAAGSDSDLSIYQFDGKEYRLKECMRRTWTDAQGRRLKQPRVAASSCEAQGKQ
jgi:hypothetical protein